MRKKKQAISADRLKIPKGAKVITPQDAINLILGRIPEDASFKPEISIRRPDKPLPIDNPLKRDITLGTDTLFDEYTCQQLFDYRYDFEKTGNPLWLLHAFITSVKRGFYPQEWVLKALCDVFEKHTGTFGELSFDSLLNFTSPGKESVYKTSIRKKLHYDIARDVCSLKLMGYKVGDAAVMVYLKIREAQKQKKIENKWNRTGININEPEPATIVDIYKRHKNALLKNKEFCFNVEMNKEKFLASFPSDALCFQPKMRGIKKASSK